MGAGGMRLFDLALQRTQVRIARDQETKEVYDEVFTGLWRLSALSGAEILGAGPDIATYTKLFTGGTLPLSFTLATEDVSNVVLSDDIRDALLRGHHR